MALTIGIDRRTLVSAAALGVAGTLSVKAGERPWYLDLRRAAFHNLNEYDPKVLDIESWMDYWSSLQPQLFVVSCGGLMAFYPTRLACHPRSQFLGERDVFGEYFRAAKKRGMRVIARIETNWAHREVMDARPEWFERDPNGVPVAQAECPWIYHTCMFSGFYVEQVTAIMREVASLYDIDGFFTNSWPDAGKPSRCVCPACKAAKTAGSSAIDRHEARIFEICRTLQKTAGEKRADRVYAIHIGGGIRSALSLQKLSELAPLLIADHQGRSGDTPIWDCAQQGRAAKACMDTRPVALGVGTSAGVWRHTAKSSAELTCWMAQAVASGMAPRYTWLGSTPPDQRWRQTGQDFFSWLVRHEKHLSNKRTIANIGVVFSQRTNGRYQPPKGVRWGYDTLPSDPEPADGASNSLQGLYYALVEGRFAFDFVHEDRLASDVLDRYTALLLPNVALLSDTQCRDLQQYVERGGSLLATFETGVYDENGKPRPQPGLAELFGIRAAGQRTARVDAYFYAKAERAHPLLSGFGSSRWLPGGEHRVPVTATGDTVLTVIKPYPQGIPELVYAHARQEQPYSGPETHEPAVVVTERGRSRLVYFPGDIDRCAWRSGNTDFVRLLQNAVRWVTREESPVTVSGKGMAEIFAWETATGYSVHLINYNDPNMTRPSIRTPNPIGPQEVRLQTPDGVRIRSVELLRAGHTVAHQQTGSTVEFVIPSVGDFEVAALFAGILMLLQKLPFALVFLTLPLAAQLGARRPVSENPLVRNKAAVEAGERRFKQLCSSCHGPRGEGGQGEGQGPNLVNSWEVRRANDERLTTFIRKGVPGTAMPAFALPDDQILELTAFVRGLNAPAASMPVPGNPELGKAIFNGKGGCTSCHMIQGKGGYLGPDLSNAGAIFRLDELRNAILTRGALSTEGYRPVMVRVPGQAPVKGIVRHESPWSLQILDENGRLFLLHGDDMKHATFAGKSWMPDDYRSRLSPAELENLLAYLSRQAIRPSGQAETAGRVEPQ